MLDASLASFEKLSIVATVEESSLASDDITMEPHVSLLDPMNIYENRTSVFFFSF